MTYFHLYARGLIAMRMGRAALWGVREMRRYIVTHKGAIHMSHKAACGQAAI